MPVRLSLSTADEEGRRGAKAGNNGRERLCGLGIGRERKAMSVQVVRRSRWTGKEIRKGSRQTLSSPSPCGSSQRMRTNQCDAAGIREKAKCADVVYAPLSAGHVDLIETFWEVACQGE